MISSIYWNPDPNIFTIPWVNWPVAWYGLFFAAGFFIGYFIFVSILHRFLLLHPDFQPEDILDVDKVHEELSQKYHAKEKDLVKILNHLIHDTKRFPTPQEGRLSVENEIQSVNSLKEKARAFVDHFAFYVVIGTVLGARLGHLLFYETPAYYISQPMRIFYVWEGGLASHGAIVGIILSVLIFYWVEKKRKRFLINWRHLLDFVTVPTAFVGSLIRLGNFFNQEIVGTPTDVPWAVTFGKPFDGSAPISRHPVQLYESLFYFAFFWVLWALSYRVSFLTAKGRLTGFFLIVVFSFRIYIEKFKVSLSNLDLEWWGSMGQILSIPAVILGIIFLIFSYRKAF